MATLLPEKIYHHLRTKLLAGEFSGGEQALKTISAPFEPAERGKIVAARQKFDERKTRFAITQIKQRAEKRAPRRRFFRFLAGFSDLFRVDRRFCRLLVKFFDQQGDAWQLARELRDMVQFRPLNLMNDFSALGTFDVVFCRNVLIYFDQACKTGVLERIARQMPDDGYLVLGAAETVIGLTDAFKPLPDKRGIYVRNEARRTAHGADNVIRLAAAKA